MDIFDVLLLIGGLAMALFGMNVMSTGLERMSGGALERTLERSTDSRIKGVLLGAGVTAIIQSSSATTVMVVGFVNSGIMKLSQSIGIIMGANIGTTATAWILSLTGIQGDSVLVQMLKPSSFAPVLAFIGVVMLLFCKKSRRKTVGSVLCGFAVLMFGMTTMTDAVKPLSGMPGFVSAMTMFQNPLLGVLVGAVFTGIIQSSSTAVGILQALSMTGGITYGAAIPIIMGQNIGTCATALLSCIGASRNARRTAMVHLYFNLIGTALFLSLFYAANAIFDFAFVDQALNPAGIAVVHTVFNVLATAVLLPFSDLLGKLATRSVPDRAEDGEVSRLDDRFLAMPSFALEQSKVVADDMARLARETLLDALSLVNGYDEKKIARIMENEDKLDRYEDRLGAYLVKLSCERLLAKDSRAIGEYLHVIGDFERIGDHAVNLVEVAEEMHDKRIAFSEQARKELAVFQKALTEIVTMSVDAFIEEDAAKAQQVEPLEQVIDGLQNELRARHIERLRAGVCTIELGFVLSDLLTNLERISDHCSNIAACLIQTQMGAFDMHSYLEQVKAVCADEAFSARMRSYSERYRLPAGAEEAEAPAERVEKSEQEAAHVD